MVEIGQLDPVLKDQCILNVIIVTTMVKFLEVELSLEAIGRQHLSRIGNHVASQWSSLNPVHYQLNSADLILNLF